MDLQLLLIGKSGNGKSATGNSILGRKGFDSGWTMQSLTKDVNVESVNHDNRVITVVDTPGLIDSRYENGEAEVKRAMTSAEKMMQVVSGGYHAFLLVLRYGTRFTQEDANCVQILRDVFGKDVLRNFAIIVITCEDNFRADKERTGQSFNQWLEEQTGEFKRLVNECGRRVVMFDNISNCDKIKEKQLKELVEKIDLLQEERKRNEPTSRYTPEEFDRSLMARERLIVSAAESKICSDTIADLTPISESLRSVLKGQPEGGDAIACLEKLKSQCEEIQAHLEKLDKGTNALESVLQMVKPTHQSICDALAQETRRVEQQEREKHEQEAIRQQREENEQIRKIQEEEERRQAEARAEEQRRREQQEREREQQAKAREEELQRQIQREKEERERKEEEIRQAAAAAQAGRRSPTVEQKVVREVNRVVRQIGRKFKF